MSSTQQHDPGRKWSPDMVRRLTIALPKEMYDELKRAAAAEHRSIGAQAFTYIEAGLRDTR